MYKKILVPLDGSKLAECILPHVEALVKGGQVSEVRFIRVIEPFQPTVSAEYLFSSEEAERFEADARTQAESYLDGIAQRAIYDGVKPGWEVVTGRPAELIAKYASKMGADLIVIATHGRSGPSRWVYGSIADRILRSSCVPVLMVRAPGCIPGI